MTDGKGRDVFAEVAPKLVALAAYTLEGAETEEDEYMRREILLSFRMPLSIYGACLMEDAEASSTASHLELETLRVTAESLLQQKGDLFTDRFREEVETFIGVCQELIADALKLPAPLDA